MILFSSHFGLLDLFSLHSFLFFFFFFLPLYNFTVVLLIESLCLMYKSEEELYHDLSIHASSSLVKLEVGSERHSTDACKSPIRFCFIMINFYLSRFSFVSVFLNWHRFSLINNLNSYPQNALSTLGVHLCLFQLLAHHGHQRFFQLPFF